MRKQLSSGQKWFLRPYFPLIRGIILLKSGLRFLFRALEVPEPRVRKRPLSPTNRAFSSLSVRAMIIIVVWTLMSKWLIKDKNPEYHGFTFPFIPTEAGSFHSEELFPNKFINHLLLPHNSQQQTKRCYRTPHSLMLGGSAKTCWDGPDKMPTKKLIRTKCQP